MAVQRMNYFKGEILHAEDFQCEQQYHLTMRKFRNQHLHTWGIIDGLEVIPGVGKVTIKPGTAIDKDGNEIIVTSDCDVPITASCDIRIKFKDEDDPASKNNDTTFPGFKRRNEGYEITFADTNALTLAKVTAAPASSPVTLDPDFKPIYAGPVARGNVDIGGDLTVKGKLVVQGETTFREIEKMQGDVVLGDADGDTVTLEGSLVTGHTSGKLQLKSPVDITGALNVTGLLTLPMNGLAAGTNQLALVNGNVGIGTASPGSIRLKVMGIDNTNNYAFFAGGVSTTGLAVRNDGYVGIGTTTPGAKLEIKAGSEGQAAPVEALRIWGPNTPGNVNSGQELKWAFTSAGSAGIRGYRDGSWGTHLQFLTNTQTQGSDSPQVRLHISENGNVGIGTTGPVGKLQVAGAALSINPIMQDTNDRPSVGITGNYPQLVLMSQAANSNFGPTIMLGGKNSADNSHKHWSIGTSAQDSVFLDIGYHGGSDINPHAGIRNNNGSTFMTILNNGNVGIGTLGPGAKLEVNGDLIANRYRGINSQVLNDYQTVNPASNVYLYSPGNDRDSWLFLDGADTASNWGIYHRQIDSIQKNLPGNSIGFIGGGNSDLKAYVCLSNGSAYFKGNVGIGTPGPVGNLHIAGSALSINAIMQDTNERPSIGITGKYPQLILMSQMANSSHGPVIMIGSKNSADNAHKHWSIGTSGQDSTFLDIGYHGGTDINPHAGIRNYNGSTFLTILNNGNVGIGTVSPNVKLAVNGPGANVYATDFWVENNMHIQGNENLTQGGRGRMRIGTAWSYVGLFAEASSSGANNDLVLGASSGRVRIGPDGSGQILRTDILHLGNKWRMSAIGDLWGNDDWLRMVDINNTNYYGGLAAGRLYTAQGALAGSDARLKSDIQPLYGPLVLNKLGSLRGVSFKWKKADENPSEQLGLIAQEVEPLFPELVSTGPDGMKAINYSGFIAPLIEGMKVQQTQLSEISAQSEKQQDFIAEIMKARGGADFAEYFESVDGREIEPGVSVVLKDSKIRPAKQGEIPFGVISVNQAIVGGMHYEWPDKYLRDDFGVQIMEEYQEEILIPQKQKVVRERQKTEKKTISEEITRMEVIYKNNKPCQVARKETVTHEIAAPAFQEIDLYDEKGKEVIGKHRVPVMETYEEEITVYDDKGNPMLVGSGEFVTKKRSKLNPNFSESHQYITRDKRPEWNTVGLIGQIPLRKGQPTAPSWIKIKNISDQVELWLIR